MVLATGLSARGGQVTEVSVMALALGVAVGMAGAEAMALMRAPAAAKPAWSVGAGLFAYHGMAFGHLAGELIERVSGERLVPGMLTQGGQGGRPAPLASRFLWVPTHFPLDLYGI